MRTAAVVGHIGPTVNAIARKCAWCARWLSVADYEAAHKHNAVISHGCCARCEAEFYARMDQATHVGPSGEAA